MTLIRFQPQRTSDITPALATGEMLRDFMNLHFPFFPQERAGMNTWSPALDVHDDNDAFTVSLEAPGLTRSDFEISWHDGVLSIAGERKESEQTTDKRYYRRERTLGRFSRSISLPAEVQADKIGATYKDGVLIVTLPKAEQAKPKQIEVSVK